MTPWPLRLACLCISLPSLFFLSWWQSHFSFYTDLSWALALHIPQSLVGRQKFAAQHFLMSGSLIQWSILWFANECNGSVLAGLTYWHLSAPAWHSADEAGMRKWNWLRHPDFLYSTLCRFFAITPWCWPFAAARQSKSTLWAAGLTDLPRWSGFPEYPECTKHRESFLFGKIYCCSSSVRI